MDLSADSLKPDSAWQVACIFPKGEEDRGKAFIQKLKEGASRRRSPIELQAVFVQSYDKESIDFSSMQKSASLSGSEYIFFLISKDDQGLFKDQIDGLNKGTWKGRVVFVDQIHLRTLYADILTQVGQKA